MNSDSNVKSCKNIKSQYTKKICYANKVSTFEQLLTNISNKLELSNRVYKK